MAARIGLALGVLAIAIGGAAIHPFGPVKQNSQAPLLGGAVIDGTSLERLQRACASCHSEQVQWPWYSYVAPTSWLIEKDVNEARAHLDLSSWPNYTAQDRITVLSAIGAVLRTNAMPPRRYRVVHPESALTEAERNALYEWAKRERRRLRALAAKNEIRTTEETNP